MIHLPSKQNMFMKQINFSYYNNGVSQSANTSTITPSLRYSSGRTEPYITVVSCKREMSWNICNIPIIRE